LWCVITSETGVSVSGVVVPGGVILGSGDRMGRAGPLRAGSAGVRVCPRGWWVLHTRAHRVLVGTAESCGTALSVTVMALLPCAQPPHRTWEPDHHTPRSPEKLVIPTKTSLGLTKAPVSHVQHQRQPHPKHAPTAPHTEIGPVPHRDRSNSARPTRRRSTHNKLRERRPPAAPRNHRQAADPQQRNRSRRGIRPISRQSTTDLEPEYDRYRRGLRPISTRGAGHRATVYGRRPASPRARTTSSL